MTVPDGFNGLGLSGDRVTNALRTIDDARARIHDAKFYEAFFTTSVLAGGVYRLSILTPAMKIIHYTPSAVVTSGDKVTMQSYEGSTVTADTGSLVPITNHNRTLPLTIADMVLKSGVTVTADGDLLTSFYLPGATGVGGSRTGSLFGVTSNEMALRPSTVYTYKFTNGSSAANIISANFFWYEEDGV